jgi:hypothetical protein
MPRTWTPSPALRALPMAGRKPMTHGNPPVMSPFSTLKRRAGWSALTKLLTLLFVSMHWLANFIEQWFFQTKANLGRNLLFGSLY